MAEDKKSLERQAHQQLDDVMASVSDLISCVEVLDDLINRYRGLGVDASVRQFYQGSQFRWPHQRLRGLKAWQTEYQDLMKRSA